MTIIDQQRLALDLVKSLESMASLLCEEAEEYRNDLDDYCAHVRAEVRGDGRHTVVNLSGDHGFLVEYASSMLAVMTAEEVVTDEVDLENQGVAALLQLGNVASGEVARVLGSEHAAFDLSPPETISRDDLAAFEATHGEPSTLICVASDEGFLRVSVYLEA